MGRRSRLPALFLTSHIKVCARCLGSVGLAEVVLSADRPWGSVPEHRLQKPNVPRQRPLFVNALASSVVRATSEALLLRALVDSRDGSGAIAAP